MDYRVILFHKHHTSARTRFMKLSHNSVLAFEALNPLAQLVETPAEMAMLHPAYAVKEIESQLGLTADMLEPQGEFIEVVDVPGSMVQILLTAITTIDPPASLVEKVDAKFIDLTEARGLPDVELELLRKAYEFILGG